jgi:hypothetical protein
MARDVLTKILLKLKRNLPLSDVHLRNSDDVSSIGWCHEKMNKVLLSSAYE